MTATPVRASLCPRQRTPLSGPANTRFGALLERQEKIVDAVAARGGGYPHARLLGRCAARRRSRLPGRPGLRTHRASSIRASKGDRRPGAATHEDQDHGTVRQRPAIATALSSAGRVTSRRGFAWQPRATCHDCGVRAGEPSPFTVARRLGRARSERHEQPARLLRRGAPLRVRREPRAGLLRARWLQGRAPSGTRLRWRICALRVSLHQRSEGEPWLEDEEIARRLRARPGALRRRWREAPT